MHACPARLTRENREDWDWKRWWPIYVRHYDLDLDHESLTYKPKFSRPPTPFPLRRLTLVERNRMRGRTSEERWPSPTISHQSFDEKALKHPAALRTPATSSSESRTAVAATTNSIITPPRYHLASSDAPRTIPLDPLRSHPTPPEGSRSTLSGRFPVTTTGPVDLRNSLARKKHYLVILCKALLLYGTPTHRIEECLRDSALALMLTAEFQCFPQCMIVSISDAYSLQNEVFIIKENMGCDVSKVQDAMHISRKVISGEVSVSKASQDIRNVLDRRNVVGTMMLIPLRGIAAVAVGSFAFGARPIDFGVCFLLGCIAGVIQYLVAPRWTHSPLMFDVAQGLITSFVARALGSISENGGTIFCFAAVAQSSVVLSLPGHMILCATEELQSKNIIAGSMRMLYAVISTLAVAFGVLFGVTAFGLIYPGATDASICSPPRYWNSELDWWRVWYVKFVWVIVFAAVVGLLNQARWKQLPIMMFIAGAGYQASYWSALPFNGDLQIANFFGAFVIGALSHLYARVSHGQASTVMLPGVLVQIPTVLSANMSLLSGVVAANNIVRNASGEALGLNSTSETTAASSTSALDSTWSIFTVAYSMAQLTMVVSVGLSLGRLLIPPLKAKGKTCFSLGP